MRPVPGYLTNLEPLVQLYQVESSTELTNPETGLGENRWLYVVRPAVLQVFSGRPTVSVIATEAYHEAWNVYEITNTTTTAAGVTTANLPGTYELKPIPVGAIVPGTYRQGEETFAVFLFYPNQFDGACG